MTGKNRFISVLIAFAMIISIIAVMPAGASAESVDTVSSGDAQGTFADCTWTLKNGVLTISGEGFMPDYYAADSPAPWGTDISKVIINSGIETIGDDAFSGCSDLTEISIPSTVEEIGAFAFSGCTSLENIFIPDSVTFIGNYAFEDCTSLKNINIPHYITGIKNNTFRNCSSLESITLPSVLRNIADGAFNSCTSLKEITIPKAVTNIGNYAFRGCTALKKIELPSSVTAIQSNAFRDCTALEEVSFSDNLVTISDGAFRDCTALDNILIPDTVTEIGDYAFTGCTGLENITLSNNIRSISSHLFSGCTSLTELHIPDSVTEINEYAFAECTSLYILSLSNNLKTISDGVFSGCAGLNDINIPEKVSSVGSYAFENCTGLHDIRFPSKIRYISDHTFSNCTNLRKFEAKGYIYDIEAYAFENCGRLHTLIFYGVSDINELAFQGCDRLRKIYGYPYTYLYRYTIAHGYDFISLVKPVEYDPSDETCTEEYAYENGYYIAGEINGKSYYTIDEIAGNADILKLIDRTESGVKCYQSFENILFTNDTVKIVKIERDHITGWYPEGADSYYIVDEEHSGQSLLFRPDGKGYTDWWDGEEGNFFTMDSSENLEYLIGEMAAAEPQTDESSEPVESTDISEPSSIYDESTHGTEIPSESISESTDPTEDLSESIIESTFESLEPSESIIESTDPTEDLSESISESTDKTTAHSESYSESSEPTADPSGNSSESTEISTDPTEIPNILENGYYVIGTIDGKEYTDINSISSMKNSIVGNELLMYFFGSMNGTDYYLPNRLFNENDRIKIAYIKNDSIIQTYPQSPDSYYVADKSIIDKTLIFTPSGNGFADWWDGKEGYYFKPESSENISLFFSTYPSESTEQDESTDDSAEEPESFSELPSSESVGVSSEETQQSSTYKESTSETVTTVNTMPSISLDDGFYLVGNLGGKSIWSPDKLNKSMCFSLKDSMKEIYALNWTFEEGDEIKIAFISDGKITQWYPEGVGNNYIIDSDHTGKKTIYFRPDGKGDAAWWDNKSGNYFLVSETETSSSEKNPVCGDADKDGIVTISDTNCIKNYLALNEVKSFSPEAADVNKNGHTDITDATLIQQWLSHFSIPYNIGK